MRVIAKQQVGLQGLCVVCSILFWAMFKATGSHASQSTDEGNAELKQAIFTKLALERCGQRADSCMTTKTIELLVDQQSVAYRFSAAIGLSALSPDSNSPPRVRRFTSRDDLPADLRYVSFIGHWDKTSDPQGNDNILGGNGRLRLELDDRRLAIPVELASEAKLSYYKAHLLADGDAFHFQTSGQAFPIFTMHIGAHYLSEFIVKNKKGFYLEYHDEPHFHQPMDESAGGVYLLAKDAGPIATSATRHGRAAHLYYLTAFKIPYGTAVYSEPGALHDDATTIGNWRVGYVDAKQFSTVTMINRHNDLVELTWEE